MAVALWVGWTLHRSGRVFPLEVYQGNGYLADLVNHMLYVGAYLVSIGFATLAIKIGTGSASRDMGGGIQVMNTKVGLVLLVLGGSHYLNLIMSSGLRWRVRLVSPRSRNSIARSGSTRSI